MLTYKNIASLIAAFAKNHPQIRENHRGNPYDIDEIQQVDGAYLVWEISGMNSNGINGAVWNMQMFFMSQVSEVNSTTNAPDVKNDCSLIAMDFVSFLSKYNYSRFEDDKDLDIEFSKNWNVDIFEDRFNSLYAGAMLNVSLTGNFNYDRCQIPGESVQVLNEEYQAVIAEANSLSYELPSEANQEFMNTALEELKAAGLFGMVDNLQWYGNDGGQDFAKIDIANPATKATLENDPSFDSKTGFTTNAIDSAVNTKINPDGSGFYQLADCSLSFYVSRVPKTGTRVLCGTGQRLAVLYSSGSGSAVVRLNEANGSFTLTDFTPGFYTIVKEGSDVRAYRDGVQIGTSNRASVYLPYDDMSIGERGNESGYSDPGILFVAIGSHEVEDIHSLLYQKIKDYINL